MGKDKLPTVQEFLKTKRIYSKKKDLEWDYIEKQMIENADTKPYNMKVHEWLQFLKELRHYKHAEQKRKARRIERDTGPPWYIELSSQQREVLATLKANIHQDLLEDLPRRIRVSLSDLGITQKIPRKVLMKTMSESIEDPGVFIWNLYEAIYNHSPSELRPKYDMNARILLSSLVFIDLDECVNTLDKLTHCERQPTVKKETKQIKHYKPKGKYGEYLQKMSTPLVSAPKASKAPKSLPLGNKLRLRSDESYEELVKGGKFLEKRKDRNKQEKAKERVCNYKFWEPPSTLRNNDPKMVAYVEKLKMLKKRAKPKFKTPYENVQYLVGNVSFAGGKPTYVINNVSILQSGYILINGGIVMVKGEAVTSIIGFWKYPVIVKKKCDPTCDCLTKWEEPILNYLADSKCKCRHRYDFYNEGKAKEKYFYQPTKDGKLWIDYPKIYQMDPVEDFIKDTVRDALKSGETTPTAAAPSVSASELKESELLAAFLADLSETPLLIPHLPQANNLNNLQEWVRKRVKGEIAPKKHKRMLLQSQRRWLDLKHVDHRARAYGIPFTQKQLGCIKWSHRYMVQKLFDNLLDDFVTRNRLKQVEQTRMWWATTKFDTYPSKAFLDIFFTYLPGRMKDTHFINPYSSKLTRKSGGKTCPLNL